MVRTALLAFALTVAAAAEAQSSCSLRLEAALVEPDPTIPVPWTTPLTLRFTTAEGVWLVRPECLATAKATVSFRDVHTGATYTDVWGQGEECDVLMYPRLQSVAPLTARDALELRFDTRTPPPGEYEVSVSYRNEPGRVEGACDQMRGRPLWNEEEPWRQEVACYMEESTPCEVTARPFTLIVPGSRAP